MDCPEIFAAEDKLVIKTYNEGCFLGFLENNQPSIGPFDTITDISSRTEDNPYYFRAQQGGKNFGIDKNLKATEEELASSILGKKKEQEYSVKRELVSFSISRITGEGKKGRIFHPGQGVDYEEMY